MEGCEIAQWVKALDMKLGNLNLILRIYMVVGKRQVLQAVLISPHSHRGMFVHVCIYTGVTCTPRYITKCCDCF